MMPVVQIRVMRVCVVQRLMGMRMRMRLACRISWRVDVTMMLIVPVRMLVLDGLMTVLVLVMLGQVQPHPCTHQKGCDHKTCSDGLA